MAAKPRRQRFLGGRQNLPTGRKGCRPRIRRCHVNVLIQKRFPWFRRWPAGCRQAIASCRFQEYRCRVCRVSRQTFPPRPRAPSRNVHRRRQPARTPTRNPSRLCWMPARQRRTRRHRHPTRAPTTALSSRRRMGPRVRPAQPARHHSKAQPRPPSKAQPRPHSKAQPRPPGRPRGQTRRRTARRAPGHLQRKTMIQKRRRMALRALEHLLRRKAMIQRRRKAPIRLRMQRPGRPALLMASGMHPRCRMRPSRKAARHAPPQRMAKTPARRPFPTKVARRTQRPARTRPRHKPRLQHLRP